LIQILPARSRWPVVGVSYGIRPLPVHSRRTGRPTDCETAVFNELISFDWNCSKYITPRFKYAELELAIAPLQHRIAESEARMKGSISNLS